VAIDTIMFEGHDPCLVALLVVIAIPGDTGLGQFPTKRPSFRSYCRPGTASVRCSNRENFTV